MVKVKVMDWNPGKEIVGSFMDEIYVESSINFHELSAYSGNDTF